ncbi:hypothetical protein [Deinococcus maricopensis]|uniref:Uncharacterized protein n=1 Tax=Deinococcus maricopensis (strain DSM 21211 / LMG 22137 / NRRL B-23946 / LB-34) TaxID=709986 RepID=E8UAW4_DEIML|nr:hypothetical protein [Deinococcus maricopensis]ADV68203.1 hypothetical protein Deima_2569 [Deinococcus maricopensis DSM 21211]
MTIKRHYDVLVRNPFPHHWLCGDAAVKVDRHGDTLVFTSYAEGPAQPFSVQWPIPSHWDGTYGFYEVEPPLRITEAQYRALISAAGPALLASA